MAGLCMSCLAELGVGTGGPVVVTPTDSPTIRLKVKGPLTRCCPNSDAFAGSTSRWSGCGLCVIVVKSRLSVSVTVRRISCVNVSPIDHSSKYLPAIISTPFALSVSKDRKRVVYGKGVSVRVDLGGRGRIKKKNKI